MARTLRKKYDEVLSYDTLMEAHRKSRKGKGYRIEIIEFNLRQGNYIFVARKIE